MRDLCLFDFITDIPETATVGRARALASLVHMHCPIHSMSSNGMSLEASAGVTSTDKGRLQCLSVSAGFVCEKSNELTRSSQGQAHDRSSLAIWPDMIMFRVLLYKLICDTVEPGIECSIDCSALQHRGVLCDGNRDSDLGATVTILTAPGAPMLRQARSKQNIDLFNLPFRTTPAS